ncbi:MAG: extracellular solute-binding protein [Tagaea sp.]|nr:extracellular solute-binding protein [Tagaea sp.]
MFDRRRMLAAIAGGVSAAALGAPARAQSGGKLTVVAHAVHRGVATTGAGGDVTAAWRAANAGAEVEWLTFGIEAVNERALREASLNQGGIDVAFMLDRYTGPQFAHLFEDLREWQARDPIPGFEEIPAGMLRAHTFGGRVTGMPYRHATHGLHVNRQIMEERGVAASPRSVTDLPAVAERLSFDRPDGARTFGFVLNMEDPATPIDWIRGFGGDFVTDDYKCVVDQAPAVRCVTMLRDLVQKNVIPRNIMSLKNEDINTYMQQGRAAMTNNPFGRFTLHNNPASSRFPGKIDAIPLPLGVDGNPIPAKTSVWAMYIPRNARDKARSWSFIKHLSLAESTTLAALNGNGPVRPSTYADPRVRALLPYAKAERDALRTARLVVPSFENAGRAMDAFMEELGLAMLGRKTPQQAMADVKRRVDPMLP